MKTKVIFNQLNLNVLSMFKRFLPVKRVMKTADIFFHMPKKIETFKIIVSHFVICTYLISLTYEIIKKNPYHSLRRCVNSHLIKAHTNLK